MVFTQLGLLTMRSGFHDAALLSVLAMQSGVTLKRSPRWRSTVRALITSVIFGLVCAFANVAPAAAQVVISPSTLANGTQGIAYSQTLSASGGTAPYTYTLFGGTLPLGLTLSTNGRLSGTPTNAGVYNFTISAVDSSVGTGAPFSAQQAYTVSVGMPTISIAPATLSPATFGQIYNQTITASGGTAPYSFAVITGALPAGLTLSSTGTLSGTPTAAGTFNLTVQATDSFNSSGSRAYSFTINAPTISVAPATLSPPTFGQIYNQTITASGGTAPYSFAVITGALPAGLTLSPTGTLSGTPTAAGTFNLTVQATDPFNSSGSRAYSFTINAPTISVAPASLQGGSSGTAYLQTLTASGGTAPYSFAITAGALPAGLTLAANGTLAGTPSTSGSFTFTATATDASAPTGPYTGNRSYTIAITAAVPTVTSIAPNNGSPIGGTSVTISGTNFTGATAVTIGGTAATAFTVTSATSITATTPAHAPGAVDVAVITPGGTGTGAGLYTYTAAITTTALMSSHNPSQVGQAVTFTANVASNGGSPTGTVTFLSNGNILGTATLTGGVASVTTTSLSSGSTTITASYGGSAGFAANTSAALIQVVTTSSDSLKLRSLQVLATPTVAQASGQAISGAIDSAISEGFAGGGALMAPSGSGLRFNFAGESDATATTLSPNAKDPFLSGNTGRGAGAQQSSRVDDAFSAMNYAMPTKAPPLQRISEPRDWLAWAEVRGATLDRWSGNSVASNATPTLYGNQVNLLAGLTRKITPTVLVGVLGGYETFDYRSDALQGHLKGDGWTVGAYLGVQLATTLRYDAALAYSGIGYDGTAGTASGAFGGQRWLFSTGLTGTHQAYGMQIEPSARVYALWENENAYIDSIGTAQEQRRFSTGRASGGVKLAYPIAWSQNILLAPYAGLYGDYYFNTDSASITALLASSTPAAIVLDGWSARATAGLAASFGNGATIAFGGEFGGIGATSHLMTYRARASLPFSAR